MISHVQFIRDVRKVHPLVVEVVMISSLKTFRMVPTAAVSVVRVRLARILVGCLFGVTLLDTLGDCVRYTAIHMLIE